MQLTDLKPGASYAHVRGADRFGDDLTGIHYHSPERAIFKETTEDGKARVVLTTSEWNDAGAYANAEPSDLFMTWDEWKAHEHERIAQERAEHDQWRLSTKGDEAFAAQIAAKLEDVGVGGSSSSTPQLVDGEYTFSFTALEMHDLLRMVDY